MPAMRAASEQRPGCRRDVLLPHQAFADEESRNVDPREPCKIGWGEDAALANDDAIFRDHRSELLAGCECRFEGLQVTVVDANQP